MTNEQILKRLAEIEGWYVEEIHGHVRLWVDENFCESGDTYGNVDPLTNWSDLGPLIEKYEVRISNDEEGIWDANVPRRYGSYPGASNQSLPHAICLAIIEAKGGMEDE